MNDRRVTCLPAALTAIVLVAGCGTVAPSAPTGTPRTSPTVASVTPAPSRPGGIPSPIVTDPGAVTAAIGAIDVPGGTRLLPAYLPPGMTATVRTYPHAYQVTYTDDLVTRIVDLAVNAGANPPPITGSNGSQTYQQFRGARTLYTVYDTTAPLSQRYLLWPSEKGIATGPAGPVYFLAATGLTEVEFFRIANSLQPV
jgi:hypothetical protein